MIGKTISHYDIRQKLGAGGMGEIYKATDSRLNRTVAIKVLPPGSADAPDRRRRFIQEAQAASALNHPNIITIYDIVSEQDTEYMVMEFIDGQTLDQAIPPAGMELEKTLDYAVQIADALKVAHAAGIVHRDLKPGNIMVTNSGLIKVLDFGLAKVDVPSGGSRGTTMTVEGAIMGTVNYMSPEQAQGRRVDARSDIFAFGLVLYEMVTGQRAFDGDSQLSILASILRDPVTPLSQSTRGVPPDLELVLAKALEKNPDDRWANMGEMREALHALKHRTNPTVSMPAMPPKPAAKPSPMKLAIGASAVLAVALAGALWWKSHRAAAPVASAPVVEAPAPAAVQPPSDSALTNASIIAMWKGKVPPSLIISQMKAGKTQFDLSTAGVIGLSQAGLPEYLIEAMRDPARAKVPPASPAAPEVPAPALPKVVPSKLVVADGTPLNIILMENVPLTVDAGASIRFQAAEGLQMDRKFAIAKGAKVVGTVVDAAKKKLLRDSKVTFRLEYAEAADGSKISLRTAAKAGAGAARLEHPKYNAGKGNVAAAGTPYTAYVDGDQKVAGR
jgi:serine/threonine protein kinase